MNNQDPQVTQQFEQNNSAINRVNPTPEDLEKLTDRIRGFYKDKRLACQGVTPVVKTAATTPAMALL